MHMRASTRTARLSGSSSTTVCSTRRTTTKAATGGDARPAPTGHRKKSCAHRSRRVQCHIPLRDTVLVGLQFLTVYRALDLGQTLVGGSKSERLPSLQVYILNLYDSGVTSLLAQWYSTRSYLVAQQKVLSSNPVCDIYFFEFSGSDDFQSSMGLV